MKIRIIRAFSLFCLLVLLSSGLQAIQLIFKDNKGHYHYRCTDKTGGKTIVVYRAEGVFVDGPTGQTFYPLASGSVIRSEDAIKVTEKYARIGCREKLGNAQ